MKHIPEWVYKTYVSNNNIREISQIIENWHKYSEANHQLMANQLVGEYLEANQ